jgi:ferric-dicitrate binding protein FerR (iron transport regulator)
MTTASQTRDVELEGQGYFEVVHSTTRPFRVRTHNAVIEDLGTEFVVRSYTDEPTARVVVRSGRVSVRARDAAPSAQAVLGRGDAIRIDSTGMPSGVVRADTAALFAWTVGQLRFHQVPVSEILTQLGRWYGIELHTDDSTLARQELTLTIDERESASEAIEFLASLAHARVEQRDSAVVLRTP